MRTASLIALALCLTSPSSAQDVRADEAAIRVLIADLSAGKRVPQTPDHVFWSGAFTRPSVGNERAPEKSGSDSPSHRVPGSGRTKVTPVRIEVSHSGDMAWEFSNAVISYQLKDGSKVQFDASQLRVWRKVAGQWMIAAHFSQSHGE